MLRPTTYVLGMCIEVIGLPDEATSAAGDALLTSVAKRLPKLCYAGLPRKDESV